MNGPPCKGCVYVCVCVPMMTLLMMPMMMNKHNGLKQAVRACKNNNKGDYKQQVCTLFCNLTIPTPSPSTGHFAPFFKASIKQQLERNKTKRRTKKAYKGWGLRRKYGKSEEIISLLVTKVSYRPLCRCSRCGVVCLVEIE